jgi:hypothetical protein
VLDRFSTIAALIVSAVSALCIGLLVTSHVLASRLAPGTVRAAQWQFWPRAGAPDADPYSLAIHARRGDLPLAPGEGLALFATHDLSGSPLEGRCTYTVEGGVSSVRAWTLALYTPRGELIQSPNSATTHAPAALNSSMAALLPDQPVATLSPTIAAGNWLSAGRNQTFVIVMRLYDTSLTASAQGIDNARLPRVMRKGCEP